MGASFLRRFGLGAVVAIAAGLLPSVAASAANPAVVSIGVDHATPAGHNFEYTDFFPRDGVNVHSGDIVNFAWSKTPDGLHTSTLLATGKTPAQAWQQYGLAVPDSDDGGGQLQLNPAIGAPTFPPAAAPAPGACGSTAKPCAYDGSSDLNSGANPTDGASTFAVQLNVAAGTTVHFVCLIHPGMTGQVNVVDGATAASTQAAVDSAAAAQGAADTSGAVAAANAVGPAPVTTNSDGTRTVTVTAGTHAPHVEVVEFLPASVSIRPGDKVTFSSNAGVDPHTATFPSKTPVGDPLPGFCEGAGSTDTAYTPSAGPPCGDPTKYELHFDPQPQGAAAITTATTFGSSGIIGVPPAPFPKSFTFNFPNQGTFQYYCHIHEAAMLGAIQVVAPSTTPSTPAQPVPASPKFTG